MKILKPTAVQVAALRVLSADLSRPPPHTVIHAETGSGKTLAYLLPIFSRIDPKTAPFARLRAIVVTPTRELSHQVAGVAQALGDVGRHKDPNRAIRVMRVVGEVTAHMLHELKDRPPHVLVGTPATLSRLLPSTNLGELQTVVLDEADELLRNHSAAAVRTVVDAALRHRGRPGVVTVSATSSLGLQKFCAEALGRRHVAVDLTGGALGTPPTLTHLLHRVAAPNGLFNAFTRILAALRPAGVLSFHNSAASMEALEATLRDRGVRCAVLGAAYSNAARARALEQLSTGQARVLLATEMAARGLDLPSLSHVVNFDPPSSLREYVHRAGRVGRLSSSTPGKAGTVVTLVSSDAEATGMVDAASQLGVALGELTIAHGEPSVAPLLAAADDLQAHRRHVVQRATKLRITGDDAAKARAASTGMGVGGLPQAEDVGRQLDRATS